MSGHEANLEDIHELHELIISGEFMNTVRDATIMLALQLPLSFPCREHATCWCCWSKTRFLAYHDDGPWIVKGHHSEPLNTSHLHSCASSCMRKVHMQHLQAV